MLISWTDHTLYKVNLLDWTTVYIGKNDLWNLYDPPRNL